MADSPGHVEELFAALIAQTKYEDLPREAIESAKKSIIDCIGVAMAGSTEPEGRIIRDEIKGWGGQPEAAVIGGGFKTSVTAAALANGTMAHALDYDDICGSWLGHPSVVLVPTLLALGEKRQSSGKDIIVAYVVGLEVGARLGITVGRQHFAHGWHNTSALGTIAATGAAARLLGLNTGKIVMALGIAASLASGIRENFGTMAKPLHAGNAARNGSFAALLAERGFTASEKALTGEFGFCKVLGGEKYDLEALFKKSSPLAIVSPGIWLRAYPSCGGSQSAVDAALQLRREEAFNLEDIAEVECGLSKFLIGILPYHRPKTGTEGKFSLEHCIAAALIDGEVRLAQFSDERVAAPDIQNFIPRVKYYHPPELGDTMDPLVPVTVTIRLKNGTKYSRTVQFPKGAPQNPLRQADVQDKFQDCAQRILPAEKITELMTLLSRLEKVEKVNSIADIIVGRK